MDLSVIIVNYNVRAFLEQALHSVFKALEGLRSEVYVVDNGSRDDSVGMVRHAFPAVHLIENQNNVGFARANNQAILRTKGRMICLINPDTLVQEDTFRVCMAYLDTHPDVGAIGCKILNPDGTLQLSCRRSFPTPWVALTKVMGLSALFPHSRLFGRYNLTYLDPEATTEVEALSGSFMMLRREVVDDVGMLDERFFLYGEDLDWCYRIRKKGWKIVFHPETQIIHYKGRSTQEADFNSLRVFYDAMRLFVAKHFKRRRAVFPLWFILLGIQLRGGLSFLSRWIRRMIIPAVDIGFMQLGLIAALLIRFGHGRHWGAYGIVNGVYTLVWVMCLYIVGAYAKGTFSSTKAFGGTFLGLVMNTSLTFFFPQYAYSRQVVLTAGLIDGILLGGWRLLIRLASRLRGVPFVGTVGKTLFRRRALIVGTDRSGQHLLRRLQRHIDVGYEVVGFLHLDGEKPAESWNASPPVLGGVKDLRGVAASHRVQEVIFSPEAASYERILDVIAYNKDLNLDFKLVPKELDVIIGRTSIDSIGDIPLVDLDYPIYRGPQAFLKRIFDLAVSGFIMPCVPFVWVFLKLHPGYRIRHLQISDGWGGSILVPELLKDGSRKPGIFQFFLLASSIFKGRLSFIGAVIEPYAEGAPRRGFKPGLTGLVQVNSGSSLTEEDRERYNTYYMSHYSLRLDVEILLKTLFRI